MAEAKETTAIPIPPPVDNGEPGTLAAPPVHDDAKDTETKSSGPQATEELPTSETCRKIEDYQVLDSEGKKHSFKSLYDGPTSADRVVVIFIRHFFCGVSTC
jgi:hypothetical protein